MSGRICPALLVFFTFLLLGVHSASSSEHDLQAQVFLHQSVSADCELIRPAVLKEHGAYVSIFLKPKSKEIYSLELVSHDFVTYPKDDTPVRLVSRAKFYGFSLKASKADIEYRLY